LTINASGLLTALGRAAAGYRRETLQAARERTVLVPGVEATGEREMAKMGY